MRMHTQVEQSQIMDANRIKTYPLPPAGFDPRTALPQELGRHGLPQRPDPANRRDTDAYQNRIHWLIDQLTVPTDFYLPLYV